MPFGHEKINSQQEAAEKFSAACDDLEELRRIAQEAKERLDSKKIWLETCEREIMSHVGQNVPRKIYQVKARDVVGAPPEGWAIVITYGVGIERVRIESK